MLGYDSQENVPHTASKDVSGPSSSQVCKCGYWIKTNFRMLEFITCPMCKEKMKND